jgi:uncharacterized protein YbjQ (UPF0145 family)
MTMTQETADMIDAVCPGCKLELEVDRSFEHKMVKCPGCNHSFLVRRVIKIPPPSPPLIMTTTSGLDGYMITNYLGIVCAQVVAGVNLFKDILGDLRDLVGGRSETLEKELQNARGNALRELQRKAYGLGATAIIGLTIDYETIGTNNGMLMVVATGTAVRAQSTRDEDMSDPPDPM